MKKFNALIEFVRGVYPEKDFIPLHEPLFQGNEKKYLNDVIESTFVSTVGKYVGEFESLFAKYVGTKHAVAVVNGTAALHTALILGGVRPEDEVITQPLTFVATCNAISYCGAQPVFVDVSKDTLGLCAGKLESFLSENADVNGDVCINRKTGKVIRACVPMHTFGHALDIERIVEICEKYKIIVIEDAAEALGSFYEAKHLGTFGQMGIFSFNGNKVITTGGGGMIVTDDDHLAARARHITTTAKEPHKWEYVHDELGFNYRLPNLNAALGCAQMENISTYVDAKRKLADRYKVVCEELAINYVAEPKGARSNYWLNAILVSDIAERDSFLDLSNSQSVMTRPVWKLMNSLSMYSTCQTGDLSNSRWLQERLVNIPSSVIIEHD